LKDEKLAARALPQNFLPPFFASFLPPNSTSPNHLSSSSQFSLPLIIKERSIYAQAEGSREEDWRTGKVRGCLNPFNSVLFHYISYQKNN
jgi:hypothetical protein